jgi:hypothetical protein
VEAIETLVKLGADPLMQIRAESAWTLMHAAAYSGFPKVVEELVKLKAYVRCEDSQLTPIHLAAGFSNVDTITTLAALGQAGGRCVQHRRLFLWQKTTALCFIQREDQGSRDRLAAGNGPVRPEITWREHVCLDYSTERVDAHA